MNLDLEDVPRPLYFSNNKPVPKEGMEKVLVGAGGKKKIEFTVNAILSNLR